MTVELKKCPFVDRDCVDDCTAYDGYGCGIIHELMRINEKLDAIKTILLRPRV